MFQVVVFQARPILLTTLSMMKSKLIKLPGSEAFVPKNWQEATASRASRDAQGRTVAGGGTKLSLRSTDRAALLN